MRRPELRSPEPSHPAIRASGMRLWALMNGGREDRRRRTLDALARCLVLSTDRNAEDERMAVPYGELAPFLDPVTDPDAGWWPEPFRRRLPPLTAAREASRRAALERISRGGLDIDDGLGVWNGSFFHGLRLSGALRRGPGTEFRIWGVARQDLVADLADMPLVHRLEPKAGKHGQRRLRRCYAAFLPPEDPTGRSVLAGLFAGAILREGGGGSWLELPDDGAVRGVLDGWGIPARAIRRGGRGGLAVSPLFGALVAHLMPPRSAARALSVRRAGGCPFLAVVLWEMALARRKSRYMPFHDALPFGCSKAAFFRRGWRRRDLHRIGWIDLGIRITPRLRGLLADWRDRRTSEREGRRACGQEACPPSPNPGIRFEPFDPGSLGIPPSPTAPGPR